MATLKSNTQILQEIDDAFVQQIGELWNEEVQFVDKILNDEANSFIHDLHRDYLMDNLPHWFFVYSKMGTAEVYERAAKAVEAYQQQANSYEYKDKSYNLDDFTKTVKKSSDYSKKNYGTDITPDQMMGLAVEEVVSEIVDEKNVLQIAERILYMDLLDGKLQVKQDVKKERVPVQVKSTNAMKVEHVGQNFGKGDFRITIDGKVMGYIDIKDTKMRKNNEKRWLNIFHMHKQDMKHSVEDIPRLVFSNTHYSWLKRKTGDRILIYIFPDDGYWATYVLQKVREKVMKDLNEISIAQALNTVTLGELDQLWYGSNKK